MKRCKFCQGKGFTMTGLEYVEKWYGIQAMNKKETCKKCYGKGVR